MKEGKFGRQCLAFVKCLDTKKQRWSFIQGLVLSSNADLAFSEGAELILADKELKAKKKEIDRIEAEWSKAQKDITRAKIAITDEQADKLAREQAKNKLLSQCIENGTQFNFNASVSSQKDVHPIFQKSKSLVKKTS